MENINNSIYEESQAEAYQVRQQEIESKIREASSELEMGAVTVNLIREYLRVDREIRQLAEFIGKTGKEGEAQVLEARSRGRFLVQLRNKLVMFLLGKIRLMPDIMQSLTDKDQQQFIEALKTTGLEESAAKEVYFLFTEDETGEFKF